MKVLQTPGCNARISTEWRPSKLLCKRFNVPDPFFGRSETSQREQSSSNRMSKTIDTASLLGISSHSASAVVDVAALERLAAALKQTADEDKVKQAASQSQTQLESPKIISNDKMAVLPEVASDDHTDPLPRAPDDLFASIFGLDEGVIDDVELPPALVPAITSLTKEHTIEPISNDELATLYSSMSKGSGPVTSALARTRKFTSSWDEAPQTAHGVLMAPVRRATETPSASVLNHGVSSDATTSASNFLKTMSSDAFDGFLPSMDELQRDSGASFKLLKSRDSINPTEQLPSWRSKLAPASEQSTGASMSIKDKVDVKMQALVAAREALVSATVTILSKQPETSDVMHGPCLPPPGSAWAGPSWQPKPVSWASAPAVRGSQPSVLISSSPSQPSHQNVAQSSSVQSETHMHSSRHKHRDSSREHKSTSSASLSEDASSRRRHHKSHRSDYESNHSRDDRDIDKVKSGHKHRHHSDDRGDRSGSHRH